MDAWTQVYFGSADVTAVQLNTEWGKVLIINVFNDRTNQQGLKQVIQVLRCRAQPPQTTNQMESIICLCDFNLHHPMGDECHNAHLFTRSNLDAAQQLIVATAEFDLQMALPKN